MSTTTQPPKPKRRWCQFSLRTLLVVMTLFCVTLGIASYQARRQKAAVNKIHELGGVSLYEYNLDDPNTMGEPPGPAWLVGLIGIDYFDDVVAVGLRDLPTTDADLELLRDLPDLRQLSIRRTNVTDAGLEHLKGLKHLEYLGLEGTNVTDEGVKKLQRALPNCKISH